jgi:class 3 adenylate cyclase
MSESEALFSALRRSADVQAVDAIEHAVREGPDWTLNRVNVLDFANRHGLAEEPAIGAFLHAARIGIFDLSWNVLCPSCGCVLEAGATLKSVRQDPYCAFCAAGSEPVLDDTVEVTFTVSPRIRRIAAHDPERLPVWEYYRQILFGSGVDLPEDSFETQVEEITIEQVELPPGDKAVLSLQLPAGPVIVLEPVTHRGHFLDVKGASTRDRQHVSIVFDNIPSPTETAELHPGPVRVMLENHSNARVLPVLWSACDRMHELFGHRKPFLTAKRLLSNQTFRDLFRADTLDVDQRLKITSLTFLFTDLKGSTELYDQVGDLVAFDLVRSHFRVLLDGVAAESGAVVKTIGDAVMATFPTPDRAVSAAIRIRAAMRELNAAHGRKDLLLKMGIHEGPCLAVLLNDHQDYFGQTVNIASRVQGTANSTAIVVTDSVVRDSRVAGLLERDGLRPETRNAALRGLAQDMALYEIP